MTKSEFIDAVESYCVATGADGVTSYWRCKRRNTAVGGKEFSAHQVWLGMDVVYSPAPTLSMEKRKEWAKRLGLFLWPESDHDHLQPLNWSAG